MRNAIFVSAALLTLAACNSNTAPGNDRMAELEAAPSAAPQESAAKALANVAPEGLYPGILSDADVASIGGTADRCVFRMDRVGLPSFIYGGGEGGTIKLNGKLVMLPQAGNVTYADAGLTVEMDENAGSGDDATMIVRIPGAADEVGFRGYSSC
ncbi:MAG: DUF6692 family protein [Pacificimonas sp.]